MEHSTTQQPLQSHLRFQMWDKHLTALNTLWDLHSPCDAADIRQTHFHTSLWNQHLLHLNQTWHVSPTLALQPPPSFLGRLLFPVKKLILRWIQPAIDAVMQQQNNLNAQLVQTCNSLVELTNQEVIRKLEAQTEVNAKFVQGLNDLVDLTSSELERLREEIDHHLVRFQAQLDKFQAQLDTFQTQFDTFQTQFDMFQTQLGTFQTQFDTFQTQLGTFQTHLSTRLEQITPQLQEFQTMIWTYDRRKEALELEQIRFNQKLEQILALLRSQPSQTVETAQQELPGPEHQQEYAYLLFENRYRGNEEEIKQRQAIYLPYFKDCRQVLDIGCGRGEFLELLQEHQIGGHGIDSNRIMVEYCREKHLNAEHAEALGYLESLADESLDGIFAAQFVEHCSPEHLFRLFELCYAKLQPHAYLVLETQNPQSLFALSHFYRDLSHNKPVHPDALQYLLKTIGFEDLRVEYLSPLPPANMLQELDIPKEIDDDPLHSQSATLNRNIRQLNDIIYGYLDYAIIARKIHLL